MDKREEERETEGGALGGGEKIIGVELTQLTQKRLIDCSEKEKKKMRCENVRVAEKSRLEESMID